MRADVSKTKNRCEAFHNVYIELNNLNSILNCTLNLPVQNANHQNLEKEIIKQIGIGESS